MLVEIFRQLVVRVVVVAAAFFVVVAVVTDALTTVILFFRGALTASFCRVVRIMRLSARSGVTVVATV